MPKTHYTPESGDEEFDLAASAKNSSYKSARRSAKKRRSVSAGSSSRPQRRGRERRLSVRAVRRNRIDTGAIARALVDLAIAQAETEAAEKAGKTRQESDHA